LPTQPATTDLDIPLPEQPSPRPTGGRRRAEKKRSPLRGKRSIAALAGAALAVTGVAVGGGLVLQNTPTQGAAADIGAEVRMSPSVAGRDDRGQVISRSDRRDASDPAKEARLVPAKPRATVGAQQLSQSDPKDIARALLSDYGFAADQFGCLESLWEKESGWNPLAHNPSSGAHGIPQSLPGSKMASEGADWYSNPVTQIKWGLGYIDDRYGSPCAAWGHSQANGWY
jgi:hypothetical protein